MLTVDEEKDCTLEERNKYRKLKWFCDQLLIVALRLFGDKMVGRRIDEILAEKANYCCKSGNSYFSPIVVPVVSRFKRLYKTRLSKNTVFKGIPLHTIEESAETSHSELKSDSIFEAESQSDTSFDCLQDDDATLSQIRNLFEVPYNGNYIDDLTCLDRPLYGYSPTDISSVASPSVSLIQQFENAAKVEAATCIQKWYKMVRDRRRFLEIRHSAIVIQRYFRAGR